jgi:hypothetical protein
MYVTFTAALTPKLDSSIEITLVKTCIPFGLVKEVILDKILLNIKNINDE